VLDYLSCYLHRDKKLYIDASTSLIRLSHVPLALNYEAVSHVVFFTQDALDLMYSEDDTLSVSTVDTINSHIGAKGDNPSIHGNHAADRFTMVSFKPKSGKN